MTQADNLQSANMEELKSLAPIVIFVYKRADHTVNLLESLIANDLADKSDVYIYSDGAKGEADRGAVEEVRRLIHEAKWQQAFKSLAIREAEVNKGLANSIIAGVTEIVNKYGRIIVLEDDLVLAPQFIRYMNQCLDAFTGDPRIFAVSGWTYPVPAFKKRYKKDAWLYYRASSWGWGTWADRWNRVEFDPVKADFAGKLADPVWCEKFSRGGTDLPGMLKLQLEGKRDSWAIRWNAASVDLDMVTVYPTVSNVYNNGRDDSGTHCGALPYTQLGFAEGKEKYDFTGIELDELVLRQAHTFDSETIGKKFKRNFRALLVDHKVPPVIRNLLAKIRKAG